MEYLRENYPSREQMAAVRACATDKSGYVYPELPDDFGPHYLSDPDPSYVASIAETDVPPGVSDAFTACVFELKFEHNFYWPDDHKRLRRSLDSEQ